MKISFTSTYPFLVCPLRRIWECVCTWLSSYWGLSWSTMGNLHHLGCGSNSSGGLCNTHTSYNLNDHADRCIVCKQNPVMSSRPFYLDCKMRRTNKLSPGQVGNHKNKDHSLAFELLRKKRVVMGELGVPVLTRHTLRSHIHCSSVISALSLDAGRCCVDIGVLAGVGVCKEGARKKMLLLKQKHEKEVASKNCMQEWGRERREMLIPRRMCHV